MKKILALILVFIALVSLIACTNNDNENEEIKGGNTGNAISYYSSTLRIVEDYPTSTLKVNSSTVENLTSGTVCQYGVVYGWVNDNDSWDALGALFGGDNFECFLHIKTCIIRNCIVWESMYVTDNMDISISSVSKSSCTEATKRSIGVSATVGKKDKLTGSASFNYEQSSSSTVEYAKTEQSNFSIDIKGLDVENYKYAKAILADVEIIKVFKIVQTVEWFETKYKVSESHTYVRLLDGTDQELVLIYKQRDAY